MWNFDSDSWLIADLFYNSDGVIVISTYFTLIPIQCSFVISVLDPSVTSIPLYSSETFHCLHYPSTVSTILSPPLSSHTSYAASLLEYLLLTVTVTDGWWWVVVAPATAAALHWCCHLTSSCSWALELAPWDWVWESIEIIGQQVALNYWHIHRGTSLFTSCISSI